MAFNYSNQLESVLEQLKDDSFVKEKMERCQQSPGQSVLDHGKAVQYKLLKLIEILQSNLPITDNWRIPEWFFAYKDEILQNLYPMEILLDYTLYHDVGKPFCQVLDIDGKSHFPDHANISAQILSVMGKNCAVCDLARDDMDIHVLNSEKLSSKMQKWTSIHAITLLMTSLAEIHANATIFGGIDSISFKIKFKNIKKRGLQICKNYFGVKA